MTYDHISESYERLYGGEQLNKTMIILENINPSKKQWLLDVGCGTGKFLQHCRCNKIGIDPSHEMLKEKTNVLQAQAETLPFRDNSFDFVVSITAIHNFKDVDKAIEEIKRVAISKIVITVLRMSVEFEDISAKLENNFDVEKVILEKKDAIYFLSKI